MKKQFVTYEIALKLKKLGFDEECLACFTSTLQDNNFNQFWFSDQIWGNIIHHLNKRLCKNSDFGDEESCVAPLWQQAYNWLIQKLDFWYPYLSLTIYSDESGSWYHPTDGEVSIFEIEFDNKEEMIFEAIKLLEENESTV